MALQWALPQATSGCISRGIIHGQPVAVVECLTRLRPAAGFLLLKGPRWCLAPLRKPGGTCCFQQAIP